MTRRTGGIGRRAFLRGAAAWVATALPGAAALRAQDGVRPAPATLDLPFETTPGSRFDIVESVISTFDRSPAEANFAWDRGGMFRHEYAATVDDRDAQGVAIVRIRGRRGNGAYWQYGEHLVLYDSADPRDTCKPDDRDGSGGTLVRYARHGLLAKLSPRGEILEVWADHLDKPTWQAARRAPSTSQVQRLFLALPRGPVLPGQVHRTWLGQDHDPINSGIFINEMPLDLCVRYEGSTADIARFSVRGGAEPDPAGEAYARAAASAIKWIDRVDVEGVVDVDLASGWIRSKDQTMRIAYRWVRKRKDASGRADVARVENRRRLIVTGSRAR